MSLKLNKNKENLGAKFRYRIAFNLAKECLLGKEHVPSEPQENLFFNKFKGTEFADTAGNIKFDARTFKSGWSGARKPQTEKQSLLDEIVNTFSGNNLKEWKLRSDKNVALKNATETSIFTVGYYPGVDIQPSNWIKKEAHNDLLHEHFCALEARCLIGTSIDKIEACNQELKKIHQRWAPNEENFFFEYFDLYGSDNEYIDLVESIQTREVIKKIEEEGGLATAIIDKVIEPKRAIDAYDFFSPASVCQFLSAMPLSNNITEHPLLDFWIVELASSVLVVQGLADGFYWGNLDTYQTPKEMEDVLSTGFELLWGYSSIDICLKKYLKISKTNIFYDEYHKAFSLFRDRYAEILNEFGISVKELQDVFNEYAAQELQLS